MIEFRLRLDEGDPTLPWTTIHARNAADALARVLGCSPGDVGTFSSHPRLGTDRYSFSKGDTIQSWDIEDMRIAPIIALLALYAKMPESDPFKGHAVQRATDSLVDATGMLHPDAARQVRTWLTTLDSRGYDAISRHPLE